LAGLSERSPLRVTPRVIAVAVIGLLGEAIVYGRAPAEVRGELALAALFAGASVLAMVVGAAKLEAALAQKDGKCVVRRAAGIVAGSFLGMAAVGAASLDLAAGSVALGRVAWAMMFSVVAAALVVFAERARYAGVGARLLGARLLPLGVLALGLVVGARVTAAAAPAHVVASAPAASAAAAPVTVVELAAPPSAAPSEVAPAPSAAASIQLAAAPASPSESAAASAAPVASAAPSADVPAPTGSPGTLQIDALTSRGMLEADARGGVARRMDKLQACLADPNNARSGSLSLKIGVEPSGSVVYSRATGGDLVGTPLGACLLAVFYKMGFAATNATSPSFEITLRAP
jgi:hypothetical protein